LLEITWEKLSVDTLRFIIEIGVKSVLSLMFAYVLAE
jgi:hypothetical protein